MVTTLDQATAKRFVRLSRSLRRKALNETDRARLSKLHEYIERTESLAERRYGVTIWQLAREIA